MSTTNVLFEVGLEEMPARYIIETEKQLKSRTIEWLEDNRLTYGTLKTFITPRRFAIQIIDLIDKQPDLEVEVRGPAKKLPMMKLVTGQKQQLALLKVKVYLSMIFIFKMLKELNISLLKILLLENT